MFSSLLSLLITHGESNFYHFRVCSILREFVARSSDIKNLKCTESQYNCYQLEIERILVGTSMVLWRLNGFWLSLSHSRFHMSKRQACYIVEPHQSRKECNFQGRLELELYSTCLALTIWSSLGIGYNGFQSRSGWFYTELKVAIGIVLTNYVSPSLSH